MSIIITVVIVNGRGEKNFFLNYWLVSDRTETTCRYLSARMMERAWHTLLFSLTGRRSRCSYSQFVLCGHGSQHYVQLK